MRVTFDEGFCQYPGQCNQEPLPRCEPSPVQGFFLLRVSSPLLPVLAFWKVVKVTDAVWIKLDWFYLLTCFLPHSYWTVLLLLTSGESWTDTSSGLKQLVSLQFYINIFLHHVWFPSRATHRNTPPLLYPVNKVGKSITNTLANMYW